MGLREVTKHMKLNKIKCVIISPNCEKIQSKGTCALIRNILVYKYYVYIAFSPTLPMMLTLLIHDVDSSVILSIFHAVP